MKKMQAQVIGSAVASLLWLLACSPALAINGEEGNAGLRAAERLSPTSIRLLIGPGFNAADAPRKPGMFQVVSATDHTFQRGVRARAVKVVQQEPDGDYPQGWQGPRFKRYSVVLTLPADRPMRAGQCYWVRICSAWLIARNRAAAWVTDPGKSRPENLAPGYGIRRASLVTPTLLEVVTGAGIDLQRLKSLDCMCVTSADDPDFKDGVKPARTGRRSHLDFYVPRGWPWRFLQKHYLYLALPRPLKSGKTYELELNAKAGAPLCLGRSRARVQTSADLAINLALKVNQYGYLPQAVKYAYLGLWAGDLGAVDFSPWASGFEVRDARTHARVLAGKPRLRHRAGTRNETVYKQDLSFENTWELDLSALKRPGKYYVVVPGLGRSLAFRVGPGVYLEPFKTVMYGIFHQRCGIELKQPYTKHYRPACHRHNTEYSTATRARARNIKELAKFATDGKKHDLYGGHHDAGDWDPRSHLDVAETLFCLYEINPTAFIDGQLRIPESHNGIPDVLDEAFWALDLWFRLQDTDGGVREYVETAGDPREGDSAATDSLREFAYAKTAPASYRFAAVAAQAAIIWRGLGRNQEAATFLKRATRAWAWAEAHGGEAEHDQHLFAAAMLLRATGEAQYAAACKRHSVFSANAGAELSKWKHHDQTLGSYNYALAAKAEPQLRARVVQAFERTFTAWRQAARTTNYRYMRSPYAPNTWGTGGLPKWCLLPAMAMRLTRDPALKRSARQWIAWTSDFSLGCHPLNLCFTVRLGQRYVTSAWHHLQSHTPGLIPGLQTEAAGGRWQGGEQPGRGGMGKWPAMSLYPAGEWPDLYKYSENASPGMNEGVVPTQARTAFAYGVLLAPAAPAGR